MGDTYDFIYLAGVVYLEYANEDTGYNPIAIELTEDQADAAEDLLEDIARAKEARMRAFLQEIKGGK